MGGIRLAIQIGQSWGAPAPVDRYTVSSRCTCSGFFTSFKSFHVWSATNAFSVHNVITVS